MRIGASLEVIDAVAFQDWSTRVPQLCFLCCQMACACFVFVILLRNLGSPSEVGDGEEDEDGECPCLHIFASVPLSSKFSSSAYDTLRGGPVACVPPHEFLFFALRSTSIINLVVDVFKDWARFSHSSSHSQLA